MRLIRVFSIELTLLIGNSDKKGSILEFILSKFFWSCRCFYAQVIRQCPAIYPLVKAKETKSP